MSPLAGPRLSRISLFLLLIMSSALLPTSHAARLFPRAQDTCGGLPGLTQCGGDLPSSFCCGQDTTCTTVNSTVQAVICCPKGKDCSTIQTVPCDTTQYNATLHPDNQIHFASTDLELPKCGASCCPLGYTCNAGMCVSVKTPPSVPPPSSSSASTPTSPASASQTSSSSSQMETPLPTAAPSFDAKSFAAGFFPGLLLGALSVILFVWLSGRRKAKRVTRYSGDFGHVARTISDPIYDPQHARTDFIRRPSQRSDPGSGSGSGSGSSGSLYKASAAPIGTRALGGSAGSGLTPRLKSMWERTPRLGFSSSGNGGGNGGGNQNTVPGIGIWTGLSSPSRAHDIAVPPPAVRAGDPARNPYLTPGHTPETEERTRSHRRKRRTRRDRSASSSSHHHGSSSHSHSHHHSSKPHRTPTEVSSETIDVLMPAPSFLEPPQVPHGMRENRMTADSGHTTFTKLMERAGYGEETRESVRNFGSAGSSVRRI